MAITVSAKTRVTVSTGSLTLPSSSSYTVATDDLIVLPISTNTNFGNPAHTLSKASGTATIGTPVEEIVQQSGGSYSLQYVRVTGGGTLVLTLSNSANLRTSTAPLVLTGVDTSTPKDVEAQGGSTTNSINVGATSTVADTCVVIGGTEWNDLGTPTSSDLTNFDGFNGGGSSMSGGSGWKTVASASAFTGNLNASGGSAADWDWGAIAFKPAGGGGTDGTATPSTIARSFAVNAPTLAAGSTPTPGVIARSFTIPAATASGPGTATPDVIARTVAVNAPTVSAGSTPTPAAITAPVTIPAAGASAGSTPTPDVIARTVTIPAATPSASSTPTPTPISVPITIPAASATGGGAGTATPDVIAATVTLPAPTLSAGSSVTPATLNATVTIPAATATGGGTATPSTITMAITLPAATATGGGSATATPAAIATTITLPTPTLSAGSTVMPATLALAVALGAVSAFGPGVYTITGRLYTVRLDDDRTTLILDARRTTTPEDTDRTTEAL